MHVLLTKADKLSKQAAQRTLAQTRAELARLYAGATVQLFSSLKREGLDGGRGEDLRVGRGRRKKTKPRLKGSKAGAKKALIGIKAPAQGGEAGKA